MNLKTEQTSSPVANNIENFDWDAYEHGILNKEDLQTDVLYEDSLNTFEELKTYKGVVSQIMDKSVIIDIGYKAEGIIHINEFRGSSMPKKGDEVEVFLERLDRKGQCVLSYQKAKVIKAWDRINEMYQKGEVIEGFISSRTRGGLIAKVFNCIDCFVPGSQIEAKTVTDYDFYLNKTMEFLIININPFSKNVVLSHRALVESDLERQKVELISKLEKGQVVEGIVKNITHYGVFVSLGGIDGLIHILDLSWKRVSHPSDVLQIGDKENFVVLAVDEEKKRVQLGRKQLLTPPWNIFIESGLKEGDKIQGAISAIMDYGAKVIIHSSGVEALLHISEMSWVTYQHTVEDFFKAGEEIEAIIQAIDYEEKKISLSTKRLKEDPWSKISEKYPINSKHKATVVKFSSNSILLSLDNQVYGILSMYDFDWIKKFKKPSDFAKEGDEIEVVVLELDHDKRLVKLGHKQLGINPWDKYAEKYKVGSIHKGKVKSISDKGAILELEDKDIDPFVPLRFLEREDGTKLNEQDEVEFKVVEFEKDLKKIILSHTAIFQEEAKKHMSEQAFKGKKVKKATLGDHDELIQLRKKMKEKEVKKDKKEDKKE